MNNLLKCNCGHYHDGDVCDDCSCTIYTQSEHTPMPWKAGTGFIYTGEKTAMSIIARIEGYPYGRREEDLEFIVRAVNSHGDMLDTLRTVRSQLDAVGRAIVDAVIAKAEGTV